jgi:hypothetical protein
MKPTSKSLQKQSLMSYLSKVIHQMGVKRDRTSVQTYC